MRRSLKRHCAFGHIAPQAASNALKLTTCRAAMAAATSTLPFGMPKSAEKHLGALPAAYLVMTTQKQSPTEISFRTR